MRLGKVIGNVVSTRKDAGLIGAKLLIVRYLRSENGALRECVDSEVVVDTVGAGVGDTVLLVSGSSATRHVKGYEKMPTDITIIGVVDSAEVQE